MREVLLRMTGLKFLLLDTSEMVGVDFSARERLARICKVRMYVHNNVGVVSFVQPRTATSNLNHILAISHPPNTHHRQSATGRRVHIVWASLNKKLRHKLKLGGVFDPPPLPAAAASSLAKRVSSSNMNPGALFSSPSPQSQPSQSQSQSQSQTEGGPAATTVSRYHHFAKDLNKGERVTLNNTRWSAL